MAEKINDARRKANIYFLSSPDSPLYAWEFHIFFLLKEKLLSSTKTLRIGSFSKTDPILKIDPLEEILKV